MSAKATKNYGMKPYILYDGDTHSEDFKKKYQGAFTLEHIETKQYTACMRELHSFKWRSTLSETILEQVRKWPDHNFRRAFSERMEEIYKKYPNMD